MQSLPKIKLIAVGKIKKAWIRDGIAIYTQRLPELTLIELKDSNPEQEGNQVLTMLKPGERLIALTEEGKAMASVTFAHYLAAADSRRLVFVIGSAEGLSQAVKQQARQCLSLSAMTFPHDMARLMLVEQLYRAKTILQGHQYHK